MAELGKAFCSLLSPLGFWPRPVGRGASAVQRRPKGAPGPSGRWWVFRSLDRIDSIGGFQELWVGWVGLAGSLGQGCRVDSTSQQPRGRRRCLGYEGASKQRPRAAERDLTRTRTRGHEGKKGDWSAKACGFDRLGFRFVCLCFVLFASFSQSSRLTTGNRCLPVASLI